MGRRRPAAPRVEDEQRNGEAARIYGSDGAFAPEFAGLFGAAEVVIQPGAGHFPWLDDPEAFVRAVASFLAD